MVYTAVIIREPGSVSAKFPDFPGCWATAYPGENIREVAYDTLSMWISSYLKQKKKVPLPGRVFGRDTIAIRIPAHLETMILKSDNLDAEAN